MASNRPQTPSESEDRTAESGIEESETRPARIRRSRSVRDNQKRLGVNPEHKTEAMRKHNRGTFP